MQDLDELLAMAREAGSRPDWAQAAGGNLSVKSGEKIYIKASGCRLSEMDMQKGWVALDLKAARAVLDDTRYDRLPHAKQQDLAGQDMLKAVLPESPVGRPSLEAGFHLLGKRVCLHLHVVELLAGASLANGREWFSRTFAKSGLSWAWVDYRPPGQALARLVASALGSVSPEPDLVIMKNHGVIAYADNASQALDLIRRAQEACSAALGSLDGMEEALPWQPLCPDDVIYPDAVDLRAANAKATLLASRAGVLEPLSSEQCAALLGMEGEKYRQGLA